ncbi:PTS system mannose-specific IIA component [Oceanotoga teriensis]|jgi:mannose/fructose/sorbose-specific phosphotransferase system IIA component|uniref:PTS system mannose-specific IIA component n=1 Tax=Oceanotoga teriensis TaxID=515440 RepID=A0AA45C5L5_9BACT|nr:PTS sugar transporter subunit IIA [Oceanotoga teriensis]PWJ89008.1 PTS system mannose-specific IIA component [Oceanotoga teriensis]
MIGIVVSSHGNLAEGVLDSLGMIMGVPENVKAVCLKNNLGIEEFNKQLSKTLNEVKSSDGVLILTDLQSGTPYNSSVYFSTSKLFDFEIEIIAGLNLGMLLEVCAQRDFSNLKSLKTIALNAGRQSINSFEKILDIDEQEEEL